MNYDRHAVTGESVLAVGAPGSQARHEATHFISPDVLEVLRGMSWNKSTGSCKVNAPFDAPLFERVYEALEALGGQWNGRFGGHQFRKSEMGAAIRSINAGVYLEPMAA